MFEVTEEGRGHAHVIAVKVKAISPKYSEK